MTTPVLRIKVLPKPVLRGKMDVRFPANVSVQDFLSLVRANGEYAFSIDYTQLDAAAINDPTAFYVAVLDGAAGQYRIASLSELVQSTTQIVQHVTAAGPVDIAPNAGIVLVDQAVGAPITLNLPLASAKTCPVLISDWKGDAGTNNITVTLAGSDKFPGGLSSWKLGADTASIFARPATGYGYVL
ncbi:hypothetical protein [Rhodopseudomonas sp. B29]|uniref:hypothetical protein n=1 Tax=Rhodopseudomonas sp. B29 TaxID=95607 RepID=UPI0003B615DE|nr:hypothetical protein [Rhodopseudomonas sp. B29]